MSWQTLLQAQRIKTHQTSRQELDDLRDFVERDLQDAAIDALSADRRFATAYNAVLQLAKMVIACSGYRVVGSGHHVTSFEGLELAMGQPVAPWVAYFDTCRRKRNQVDYDCANAANDTEAQDLLQKAEEFRELVEKWIARHHPGSQRRIIHRDIMNQNDMDRYYWRTGQRWSGDSRSREERGAFHFAHRPGLWVFAAFIISVIMLSWMR